MTTTVTEFVAHYTRPSGSSWEQTKAAWNRHALAAWLEAADQRGLQVSVHEVLDSHNVIAIVEVDGQRYGVHHLGRGMELQAKPC
ncbi:hypothetical protein ACWIGW_43990 [Nocardia brasiliensis]|uniref:hypothetical protein n=1 Tax=Streptomyces sp. NPDC056056 TaxID=3345698 RepID=UPI0035D8A267